MKKQFLCIITALISISVSAQQERIYAAGMGLNMYGFGFNFKIQQPDNPAKKWTHGDLLFEIGNIVSPREIAIVNNSIQGSGVYKFGKINYAWTLRNYYMFRYTVSTRQDKKNVAMNALLGAGIPLSYAWPVYILLLDPSLGLDGEILKVKYDPEIHPQSQIAGRAPFNTGIYNGTWIPGVGINTALEFIWGNYRSDVKILTVGARVEGYSQKIPILYKESMNKNLYSYFYINFAFGFGKN